MEENNLFCIIVIPPLYIICLGLDETQAEVKFCSLKEPSMKDIQELAARMFNKGKATPEDTQNANMEPDSRKKQQHKELNSNSNLSPLARFLLSRFVELLLPYLTNDL